LGRRRLICTYNKETQRKLGNSRTKGHRRKYRKRKFSERFRRKYRAAGVGPRALRSPGWAKCRSHHRLSLERGRCMERGIASRGAGDGPRRNTVKLLWGPGLSGVLGGPTARVTAACSWGGGGAWCNEVRFRGPRLRAETEHGSREGWVLGI